MKFTGGSMGFLGAEAFIFFPFEQTFGACGALEVVVKQLFCQFNQSSVVVVRVPTGTVQQLLRIFLVGSIKVLS